MPHIEHHYTHKSPLIRAAVLGANDGIISISGVISAVASTSATEHTITLTTLSALLAGALSMGAGEFISVSSQLDSEIADIKREKLALQDNPDAELEELIEIYEKKGLDHQLAKDVATKLSENNPLPYHLKEELGLTEDDLSRPTLAALISFLSFTIGGGISTLAVLLLNKEQLLYWIYPLCLTSLALLGYISSKLGGATPLKGVLRVVGLGLSVLAISQFIGKQFL